MKKVINSEEANLNNFKIKRIALKGLTVLILGTSLVLSGCGVSKDTNQVAYQNNVKEDVKGIKIDEINLLLANAIEDMHGNHSVYVAPDGYTMGPNNVCYKLTVDNSIAPDGYSLGADGESIYQVDTEIEYYAPEGYILVGNKIIKIVPLEELNEEDEYEIYEGYGLIIEDAPLIKNINL